MFADDDDEDGVEEQIRLENDYMHSQMKKYSTAFIFGTKSICLS